MLPGVQLVTGCMRRYYLTAESEEMFFAPLACRRALRPIFSDKPYVEWEGHEADVLDMTWSKVAFVPLCQRHIGDWFCLLQPEPCDTSLPLAFSLLSRQRI